LLQKVVKVSCGPTTSSSLTSNKKDKNDSVNYITTVSRRFVVELSEIKHAAEEQCPQSSFEGDQRWRRDDVRWQTVRAREPSC